MTYNVLYVALKIVGLLTQVTVLYSVKKCLNLAQTQVSLFLDVSTLNFLSLSAMHRFFLMCYLDVNEYGLISVCRK